MQAARGTPLSPGAAPDEADGSAGQDIEAPPRDDRPRARPRLLVVFAVIAATGYALDLSTKVLAVARLDERSDVEVVGSWLTLTLVRNPGAAFSTGTEFTVVLSVISIVAALVVLWLVRRVRSTGWAIGLGVLLAGVLGNLTDRMLRQPGPFEGHVIDFLRLPNWPVFNVADICINIAAGIILLQAFRGVRLDGTRETDHRDADRAEQSELGEQGDRAEPAEGGAGDHGETPDPVGRTRRDTDRSG